MGGYLGGCVAGFISGYVVRCVGGSLVILVVVSLLSWVNGGCLCT